MLSGCTDNYYDKMLKDFSIGSYFILIKVRVSNIEKSMVIENNWLYYYFNKRFNYDVDKYVSVVKHSIKNDIAIDIQENEINKYRFRVVKTDDEIEKTSSKGKSYLIQKYFKKKGLYKQLSKQKVTYIISCLFKYRIACYIDESGYLMIRPFHEI